MILAEVNFSKFDIIYKIFFTVLAAVVFFYFVKADTGIMIFSITVLSLMYLLSIKVEGQNSRFGVILLLLVVFAVIGLSSSLFVFRDNPKKGETYIIEINVNGNKNDVLSIDGRYPLMKTYFSAMHGGFQNGRHIVETKLQNIRVNDRIIFIEGNIAAEKESILNYPRNEIRKKMFDISYNYSPELYGFLKALVLGESDYLSDETQEKFRYTGVAHILVISGSHIALVILMVVWLFEKLKLNYHAKYLAAAVILTVYVLIIGPYDSILRAYLMGIIYLLSKLIFQEADMSKSLAASFIISAVINPLSPLSVSFQLSYLAVAGMIYIYPLFKYEGRNILIETFLMSIAVQITLMPVFLVYFHKIQLFSALVNVAAIPLSAVITPFAFGGIILSMAVSETTLITGLILDNFVKVFYFIITSADKIPLLQISYYGRVGILLVLALYGMIVVCFFAKTDVRIKFFISLIMILSVFLFNNAKKPEYFLLNDKTYLTTKNGNSLLIAGSQVTENELFRFIDKKIDRIDVVVYCGKMADTGKEIMKKIIPYREIILEENRRIHIDNIVVTNLNGKLNYRKMEDQNE